MSSLKEELVEQLENINAQINQLRKSSSKNSKVAKEKERLMKIMTDLILELDMLKEQKDSED